PFAIVRRALAPLRQNSQTFHTGTWARLQTGQNLVGGGFGRGKRYTASPPITTSRMTAVMIPIFSQSTKSRVGTRMEDLREVLLPSFSIAISILWSLPS